MSATAAPMNAAVWFEIPAADFDRAVGFYEDVLHTKLRREKFGVDDMAVFPCDGKGLGGAVMKGQGFKPASDGSVVYLASPVDLDQPLARVKAAGGKVVLPKTALPPGMGYFAHFVDSEGNRVGLHSME